MVGIPRSKGCTTCRRRKIACDLTKPSCCNCARGGRTCEGYDQYPVFLNRTLNGPARRHHLEEAKQAPSQISFVSTSKSSPNLPLEISARGPWEIQIIAWFWQSYAPTPSHLRGTSVWLFHAVEVANPIPVLYQALLALSITRYGRVKGKRDLIKQGQQIYGVALRLLQEALYDSVLMWNDETLAGVRALVLYELFESTSHNPNAWHGHLNGITALMKARGPQSHSTTLARTVLEDIRYAMMLKALMLRKASLFGQPDWIQMPWEDRSKSTEQEVYDHGFQLAALLDRADKLVEVPDKSLSETINILEESNKLEERFELLFITAFRPSLQRETFKSQPDVEPDEAEISQMMIVVNLWACQLLLGFVADALRKRVLDGLDLGQIVDQDHAKGLCDICEGYANRNAMSDLAQAILRYLPLCVGTAASEFAASRTLFPITCVLWQFRHSRFHFRQATSLMRQMSEARGVRFASGYTVTPLIPFIARDDGGLLTKVVD